MMTTFSARYIDETLAKVCCFLIVMNRCRSCDGEVLSAASLCMMCFSKGAGEEGRIRKFLG